MAGRQWTYRKFAKMLKKNGWLYERSSGSHDIFYKEGKHISVPNKKQVNAMLALRLIKENKLVA
jgi:predicted RNA binding protein YcfA (HicA-like mRNA interferase family)